MAENVISLHNFHEWTTFQIMHTHNLIGSYISVNINKYLHTNCEENSQKFRKTITLFLKATGL